MVTTSQPSSGIGAATREYRQLAPELRKALAALTVFPGEIVRELGVSVLGGDQALFQRLLTEGLLVEIQGTGRFRIKDALYAPANDALLDTPRQAAMAYQEHCEAVCAWFAESEPHIHGPRRHAILDAIAAQLGSVELAWEWATQHQMIGQLRQALELLGIYYLERGHSTDGLARFRETASALQNEITDEGRALLAALQIWVGRFYLVDEDSHQALTQTRIGLAVLDTLETTPAVNGLRAEALLQMGHAILDMDVEQARTWYHRALEQFERLADRWNAANAQAALAGAARLVGEPDTAVAHDEAALALRRELNVRSAVGVSKCDLAIDALVVSDLKRSRRLFTEAIADFQAGRNPFGEVRCRAYLAQIAAFEHDYAAAAAAFEDVLPALAATGKVSETALWTVEAARVHLALGQWPRAVELAQESLEIGRAADLYTTVAHAHTALGAVALVNQEFAQARLSLDEAVSVCRSIKSVRDAARAEALLAWLDLAEGNPARAQARIAAAVAAVSGEAGSAPLGPLLAIAGLIVATAGEPLTGVEIYAAAAALPYMTDSVLFGRLIDQRLKETVAGESPDGMAAAEHRGRRRTAAEALKLASDRLSSIAGKRETALPPPEPTEIAPNSPVETDDGNREGPTFSVRFFNGFQLLINGEQTVEIESTKGQALLAYVITESPQGYNRDALATLLWPNTDSAGARRNLRQTLFNLRQTADGILDSSGFLVVSRYRVAINQDLLDSVDLYHFRERVAATAAHVHTELDSCVVCIERLTDAVSVYKGDFLAGLSVSDSEPFENWRLFTQEELFETAVRSLRAVCNFHTQRRHSDSALRHLQHLLRLEPWNEEAHRQVMRVYARDGRRNAALQQYETCRTILKNELDIGPSAETTALFEQIHDGLIHSRSDGQSNPYKGLNAFSRNDTPYFFGRTAAIERLLFMLQTTSTVLVVGPSGSGKTSLVEAGLTHGLHRLSLPDSAGGTATASVRVRPGSRPIRALAESVTTQLEGTPNKVISSLSARALLSDIEHGRLDIWALLGQVCRLAGVHHLLLHIDQFEEIFSISQPNTIRQFVRFLTQPSHLQERPLIRIVISLRADFLSYLLEYPELAALLQEHSFFLPVMTTEELRETVVRPAEEAGVRFEPGLVERLLRDTGNSSARLPLLQFALLRLWEQQEQGRLTHAAYDRIDGVGGALTDYAEQVFASLTPQERALAPRLLLRMVRSGRHHDMRRPTTRIELGEMLWPLANKLADMRLVTTGLDYTGVESVELVHDALIDGWARLRGWIDEDRSFQHWHQQMRQAANIWIEQVEDEDTLLRGMRLAEAERLLRDRSDAMDETVRIFIQAGIELRAQTEARQRAEQDRAQATGLALTAQSALMENRIETALVFATHALKLVPDMTEPARILAEAAYRPGTRRRLAEHDSPVCAIVPPSPTSGLISMAADGRICLWQDDLGERPQVIQAALSGFRAVQWLPGRRQFAVATDSADIHLLDADSGAVVGTLAGHRDVVHALAATPDGSHLISAAADHTLIVWSLETRQAECRLQGHNGAVRAVAVSPDGKALLTGGDDATIRFWDLEKGLEEQSPGMAWSEAHQGPVVAIDFAPDGQTAFSCAGDRSMVWWDLSTRTPLGRYPGLGIDPTCVRLGCEQANAYIGTSDGMLVVLDVRRGRVRHRLPGHAGAVTALAGPIAGKQILSGSEDGDIRLWDLVNGAEMRTVAAPRPQDSIRDAVQSLAVDLHGEFIATISRDQRLRLLAYTDGSVLWEAGEPVLPATGVRLPGGGQTLFAATVRQTENGIAHGLDAWNPATGTHRAISASKLQSLTGLAMGHDGRHIVTVTEEGVVRRWDARTGLDQILFDAAPQSATAVGISPDGESILIGLGQGQAPRAEYTLCVLDFATGVELQRLNGHTGAICSIAFRQDGRQAASSGRDGRLFVWDMNAMDVVMQIDDAGAGAHALSFSPDGRFLLTAGHGSAALLWSIECGTIIRRYNLEDSRITTLAFLPDGRSFLAAYEDGTIREWRLDETTDALMDWVAANRYVRPLTTAEEVRYLTASAS